MGTLTAIPPWLDHLRHDRRGIPVPYVNAWGPEDPHRVTVANDPWCRAEAVFHDDTNQDAPDFTRQHMGRQRECVVRGLCQVCARPIPWSRRYLVVAALSVEQITLQGRPVMVVTEPWLDGRCAQFALNRCPALIRRTRDEQLQLVHVGSKLDVRIVLSTGYLDGPLEAYTRAHPVVMWAKIALTGGRITATAHTGGAA